MAESKLTSEQAQEIVEERIEQFGLGALPQVSVAELPDGSWRITWEDQARTEPPMTETEWYEWFERHVGPLKAERLQTTEG